MAVIPKIVHQIWVGPTEIPKHLKAYCRNTRRLFCDHQYRLWGNDNLPNLPEKCRKQVDRYKKLKKYALSADILRYFLLNEYGGIYLDVDFDCRRNFRRLLTKSFFCVSPNARCRHVCNGVFACAPNNPILTALLSELQDELYHGPLLFTRYVAKHLGVSEDTSIAAYIRDNPNDYVECGKPEDFFSRDGYCFHDALKSWLPKQKPQAEAACCIPKPRSVADN